MNYSVEFDFSMLDRLPTWFGLSASDAESILKMIADFIGELFFYFYYFIQNTGFWPLFMAALFIAASARLLIFPFVGGRSVSLGSDRVRSTKADTDMDRADFYKKNRRAFTRYNDYR